MPAEHAEQFIRFYNERRLHSSLQYFPTLKRMEVPDVEEHRPLLEATLAQHAPQTVTLIGVPDIAEWAEAHCPNAKGNPSAMAVTDQQTKAWGILVRRRIAAAQVKSVVDRIGWVESDPWSTLLRRRSVSCSIWCSTSSHTW